LGVNGSGTDKRHAKRDPQPELTVFMLKESFATPAPARWRATDAALERTAVKERWFD
jgi:hypothetical protein